MGVTGPIAEFLLEARLAGADFDRTLTLGHQSLFVSPRRLCRLLRDNDAWPAGLGDPDRAPGYGAPPHFVDPFLRHLGANTVDVLDASSYEGAEVIHDLNQPVPDHLHEQYSVVFDGGTLEHIFNFPVALKSCMEMLRPGGRLITTVVANQLLGHGLYQFSPDLFFRALSPANGFQMERMHAWEGLLDESRAFGVDYVLQDVGPRYEVRDPLEHGGRHEALTGWGVALIIEARKLETRPVFEEMPQQSDYQATWTTFDEQETSAPGAAPVGRDSVTGGPATVARLRSAVNRVMTPERRDSVWFEELGRLMLPLDPLRYRRLRRRASLRNPAMYRQLAPTLNRPIVRPARLRPPRLAPLRPPG